MKDISAVERRSREYTRDMSERDTHEVQLEQFAIWLNSMETALDWFRGNFAVDDQDLLDLSPESLPIVEKWLLDRYEDVAAIRDRSQAQYQDAAASYIGETIRLAVGGEWRLQLDPSAPFLGLPILMIAGTEGSICPLTLTSGAVARRSGNFLATTLENLR